MAETQPKVKEFDGFLPTPDVKPPTPQNPVPVNSILGLVFPISFTLKGTEPQTETNGSYIFTAIFPCEVVAAIEIHAVAADTATTYTLDIIKDTGTGALGSGVRTLTSTFNLKAAAYTKQILQASLTTANRTMDKGDRLVAKLAHTGSAAGAITDMNVTVYIKVITNTLNATT